MPYVAQSAADGSLPLLAAAVAPDAQAGDFYIPGKQGPWALMAGAALPQRPQRITARCVGIRLTRAERNPGSGPLQWLTEQNRAGLLRAVLWCSLICAVAP